MGTAPNSSGKKRTKSTNDFYCNFTPKDTNAALIKSTPRRRMRLPTFSHQSRVISSVATNVTFQEHKVSRDERWKALGHAGGCTLWFTGLSGAGKTTIAFGLEKILIKLGIPAYGLDGDNIRHGLCKDLGFDKIARSENIRRVAEVAKLFADMGTVAIASFISPYRRDREEARRIHKIAGLNFYEIYVDAPIEVCEARDPKMLYQKARAGKIPSFTGIGSVYEVPRKPDLIINTALLSENDCVQTVLQFLFDKDILSEKALYKLFGIPFRQLFVQDDILKAQLIEGSVNIPTLELSLVDLQWLQVLAEGWASPLGGFMRERQYLQALHHCQISDVKIGWDNEDQDGNNRVHNYSSINNSEFLNISNVSFSGNNSEVFPVKSCDDCFFGEPVVQSIPIVLPITEKQRTTILANTDNKSHSSLFVPRVSLLYEGRLVAVLSDPDVYVHRKEERICRQFGFMRPGHPVADQIMKSGDFLLGGDIQVLDRIRYDDGLDEYRKTPSELREIFTKMEADAVFVFQLRNPVHNGHILLIKSTRRQLLDRGYRNPVLLLHPLGGWTKPDDVPLFVRIAQHQALLDAGVLDPQWTVLAIFPSPMLYAGPTEVQWHARARLACGAQFYIVGRDPAGIQNPQTGDFLYDPTHGAKVLSMAPGLLGLEILPFKVAAYNIRNKCMEFFDESRSDEFQFISGTLMRELARRGDLPPEGFMHPKAWEIVAEHYRTGQP